MKNIIFAILALLFPFAMSAQSVVSDTTYTAKVGSLFYEVTRYNYSADGNDYAIRQRLIGDSSALYAVRKSAYENRGRELAIEVQATATFARRINDIIRESERTKTLTGRSPLDTLQKENITLYTGNQWVIRGDTAQTITFSVTAGGLLRYRIDGGALRTADVIGASVVRLRNYPANGRNTDFFDNGKGRFITQDNRLRIQRVNEQQRR